MKIAGKYEELWSAAAGESQRPLAGGVRAEALADHERLVAYLERPELLALWEELRPLL